MKDDDKIEKFSNGNKFNDGLVTLKYAISVEFHLLIIGATWPDRQPRRPFSKKRDSYQAKRETNLV